jgi:DNA-directed RNA polymerase subunit E'
VIAISLKSTKGAKIGLTMRQPSLGKIEWIESEKEEKKKPPKHKKKKKGKK